MPGEHHSQSRPGGPLQYISGQSHPGVSLQTWPFLMVQQSSTGSRKVTRVVTVAVMPRTKVAMATVHRISLRA